MIIRKNERTYTLRIAGRDYTITSSDAPEHVRRVAVYIDRKIAETGESDTGERKNNTLIPSGERQSKAAEAYRKLKGIEIVYEDDHLLFVNKPAGILSQGDDSGQLSLNDWILGYCLQKGADEEGTLQKAVCNRLDRNTSGLVLCGKTYAGSLYLLYQ